MNKPRHHSGFTLIELMIAVAIIAGLAAIAIPSYRQYVMSSRTAECANEIAAIRLGLEELFLTQKELSRFQERVSYLRLVSSQKQLTLITQRRAQLFSL